MAVPAEVRAMKPAGTEVHDRGGRYYVYRITSVWDPARKRPRKKTLGCVGRIAPGEGFVPNARWRAEAGAAPAPGAGDAKAPGAAGPVQVREYGLWALFSQLCPGMLDSLREHLGDPLGSFAYAVAVLRVSDRLTKAQLARAYRGSWLSEELPGLALSESRVASAMAELGSSRPALEAFMRTLVPRGATLLFDGTQILCSSAGVTAARVGRSGGKQLNLMYVFDASARSPVFYRLLPGNVSDVTAFQATLEASGARDCTVVADKGFFSKANVSAMDRAGMRYVLPLRDNTTLVDTSFLDDGTTSCYEGAFEYHGRCVRWRSIAVGSGGKRVLCFRDEGRRSQREAAYAAGIREGRGDLAGLERASRSFGVSLLYTNVAEPAEAAGRPAWAEGVYLAYKSRWEIEVSFDYLKNGLDLGTVHQRTNEQAEAWAFLNHLSLTMFYALFAAVRDAGEALPRRWRSPEAFVAAARNVSRVRVDGEWRESEVPKPDRKAFAAIGVKI